MPKFKHINSASTFNSTKFSADANNSTYFLGEDLDTQIGGTPDILYTDIVFCKNNATIYTHGKFYGNNDSDYIGRKYNSMLRMMVATLSANTGKTIIVSGGEIMYYQNQTYPQIKEALAYNTSQEHFKIEASIPFTDTTDDFIIYTNGERYIFMTQESHDTNTTYSSWTKYDKLSDCIYMVEYLQKEKLPNYKGEGGTTVTTDSDGSVVISSGEVINNLTSSSTTDSLSAAQGKELKAQIDTKLSTSTADSRYLLNNDSNNYIKNIYVTNPALGYQDNVSYDKETYFKTWLKYVTKNYTFYYQTLINSRAAPNSLYQIFGRIYSTNSVSSDGLPQYCGFLAFDLASPSVFKFGTTGGTFYWRVILQ